MPRARTRKRPCRICGRWFMPEPRQIGRQKTCGDPECRRENHRRRCGQWNRSNRDYFKANYLSAKLARTRDPPVKAPEQQGPCARFGRNRLDLPEDVIVAVTGAKQQIILDYIIEQILRRVVLRPVRRPP